MKTKISDFKIMSIVMMAILIFFTIWFFRYLPLNLFDVSINTLEEGALIFYEVVSIIVATALTSIFIITYSKKNDDELKTRLKSIGIGVGVICLYYFLPYLQSLPFTALDIDTKTLSLTVKVIYLISFDMLLGSLILLVYNKKISKDIKDMKKNNVKYLNKYLKYWLMSLFVMMASNLIIHLFIDTNLPSNEQSVRDLLNSAPIYVFFSAIIFAPIVEELVFRYSFKKIFSNKWVFIILAGLVFGSMHVFNDFKNLTDLFYIIPYSAPGIAFAYMLEDSDNTLVPISFHFIHNGILISLQFLLMLIG